LRLFSSASKIKGWKDAALKKHITKKGGNIMKKIENGSGIEFTAMINGDKVTYQLTLAERKGWRANKKGDLVYIFVSTDKKFYATSIYTGGKTGFGISDYDIRKIDEDFYKEYVLLTSDLNLINQLADAEEEWEKEEKEKFDQKQKEKAERINKLPKIFDSILPEFYFERSDADYRPAYSRSIQGPYFSLNKKNDRGFYWSIDNFVTRDGKRKIKDFTKTYGEFLKNKNPKEVLEALIIQQEEIKNMIKNA